MNAIRRTLTRLLGRAECLELRVTAHGPVGPIGVPSDLDGIWELVEVGGLTCLRPAESSYYVYFRLPESFRRGAGPIWVEVEYFGGHYGEFRLQYASLDHGAEAGGLYKAATQQWQGDAPGERRFRKALFVLPDFAPGRAENLGASFRLEFRRELLVSGLRVGQGTPEHLSAFPAVAPVPELRKMAGRFYPIDYLFIEITNACNFKCTWCPDAIMDRRRGFMKKERVFRVLDEVADKRSWLGPLFPVKLHQMGEPMLHPDLAEIVARAEGRGLPIELNTNCGLITPERIEALYRAGLTNLILSYQTPDSESFRTRKAPRLVFDEYRDKVRLAIERKVALGARTSLEIDIMNTKRADGYRIVSEDEQAVAFLSDWIQFCQGLEARHGLAPRTHDWERIRSARLLDRDENGGRYTLLDGVHLVWKRCHTWGNVIGVPAGEDAALAGTQDTYCPAPHDQFVIQWNGDVVSCCTDYEGLTKTANVFASSVEGVWRDTIRHQRLRDMVQGRLLDVCARCQGRK